VSDSDAITDKSPEEIALIGAYRRLQFLVGTLAVTMPIVVVGGDWMIDGEGPRGSLSSYYYSRTGDVFVGVLWAIGVVLLSYQARPRPGFERDRAVTSIAGMLAITVALFPTASDPTTADTGSRWVAFIHLIAAAGLFGLLAVLSAAYFTRVVGSPTGWRANLRRFIRDDPGTGPRRAAANAVYRMSGWVMLGCISLAALSNAADLGWLLWLETAMVIAFAASWFRKSLASFV